MNKKEAIKRLLLSGICSTEKYNAADIIRCLYPMHYLIKDNPFGCKGVVCNDNDFWRYGNTENRLALYEDLLTVLRWKPTDPAYCKIINRFENGDGYGIDYKKDGDA